MPEYTIDAVNERLKAKGSKVKLENRGQRLNLRATLPPKPLSGRPVPYQQRIPLNLANVSADIKRAEYEADKLHGALLYNTFDWNDYLVQGTRDGVTTSELLGLFEAHYRGKNKLKDRTWQKNWLRDFNRLPQGELLTVKSMEICIKATPKNTVSRRNTCNRFQRLADFAGLETNFEGLKGVVSRDAPDRVIPSDEVLFLSRSRFKKGWLWVFSVMLLAGLRPHEAFFCEWSAEGLEVLQGKTGARTIFYETFELMYPGLIVEWRLKDICLPKVDAPSLYEKGGLGHRVTNYWALKKVSFSPYDMRHAFALRAGVTFGISTATVAALMGHSETVHIKVYRRWINKDHNKKVLRAAITVKEKSSPKHF